MRFRAVGLLSVLALVVAACGTPATDQTTTSTTVPLETTTTAPAAKAVVLSYSLDDATTLTYEIDFEISVDMSVTGDTAILSDAEDFPGELDIVMKGATTLTYDVAPGVAAGTYEVTITGEFDSIEISGTAAGEDVSPEDIPELTNFEPVEVTIVIDEQGNLVGGDDGAADLFGGGLGSFMGTGMEMGRFVGPPMPAEEVELGSTWSNTFETPLFLGDPITTQIDSEVTGVSDKGIFEIETTTVTSEVFIDMGAFLVEMFAAFVPDDASEEDLAEIELLKDQLKFLFTIDESTANMTTLFDPSIGFATEATFAGSTNIVMDVNMPDEETGELIAFLMDMAMTQNVTYRLVG